MHKLAYVTANAITLAPVPTMSTHKTFTNFIIPCVIPPPPRSHSYQTLGH